MSVNHRVAAFLASYFDVLLAINRVPHPGEKRLLALVEERCTTLPQGMADDVRELLHAAGSTDTRAIEAIDRLVNALDQVLVEQSLISP